MLEPGKVITKRTSVNSLGVGNLLHANRTGQWPGRGGGDIATAIREASPGPRSQCGTLSRANRSAGL